METHPQGKLLTKMRVSQPFDPVVMIMLRYAILIHDYPHLHWDLLVEHSPDERLTTWRLEHPPEAGVSLLAEALPDHRRLYLDYEGPISGNRGEVKRWDSGEVKILSHTPASLTLEFKGNRLQGKGELIQLDGNLWRFCYTPSQAIPMGSS